MEKKKKKQNLKENEKKWGKPSIDAGWTLFPSVILERQQALGLDAVDFNIIMHLVKFWWFDNRLPHPAKKTIANCMGIHPSTVQRRIADMEKDGLIRRIKRSDDEKGQQSNQYDLSGLIEKVQEYAMEHIRTREDYNNEKEKRTTRKRVRVPKDE